MGGPAGLEAARARAEGLVVDLRAELAALAEATAAGPDDEHDAEGATIGFERARVAALLATATAEVDALGEAAARADRGEASRCRDCGGPIAPERVAALPAAQRCVGCAAGVVEGSRARLAVTRPRRAQSDTPRPPRKRDR